MSTELIEHKGLFTNYVSTDTAKVGMLSFFYDGKLLKLLPHYSIYIFYALHNFQNPAFMLINMNSIYNFFCRNGQVIFSLS